MGRSADLTQRVHESELGQKRCEPWGHPCVPQRVRGGPPEQGTLEGRSSAAEQQCLLFRQCLKMRVDTAAEGVLFCLWRRK